jgi:hypothetical protein
MTQLMRIAPWTALLVGSVFLSCSREKPKEAGPSCNLVVQGTSIQYNGHPLPLPGALSDWERVLGKPSRKIEVASDVYAWDELGLFAGTQMLSSELRVFSVLLSHGETANPLRKAPAYYPRSTFKGRLCVDGSEITPTSRIAEVNQHKEGQPFKRGYLDRIYSYDILAKPVNAYVRIDLTDEGTPETFGMDFSD